MNDTKIDLTKNNNTAKASNGFPIKIFLFSAIYIGCVLLIAFFGIKGDTSKYAIDNALKYFTPETISIARKYFIHGLISSTLSQLFIFGFLLFIAQRHPAIDRFIKRKIPREMLRLSVYILFVFTSIALIAFPFAIFSGYIRKLSFGLIEGNFAVWLYRYGIIAGSKLLATSVAIFLFAMILRRCRKYRIFIPVLFMGISFIGILLYPRYIIPLIHKREVLAESPLKNKLQKLLADAQMPVQSMYIINESAYSKHINAFFTGWGPYREIYLFDTLLKNYNEEETLAVIAHELCHYREEHVLLGIAFATAGVFFGIFLLERLSLELFGKNLSALVREMNIAAIWLIAIALIFFAQPIKNSISRAMEHRCDVYACRIINEATIVAETERKIAIANRREILPHPIYHFWYGSHPTPLERILHAKRCK
ncbi:MAG: M48 family metalloprotease [Spirochaetes bacterium]|nr:M48 family metalloprotease [Spirochaetota bacterium]